MPPAPFTDQRHDGEGIHPQPEGHERMLLEATLAATDLVIASPLYWYSVSADTKLYLDYWAGWMRVPGYDFRARMAGKTLWTVSASSSEPAASDALLGTLQDATARAQTFFSGPPTGAGPAAAAAAPVGRTRA